VAYSLKVRIVESQQPALIRQQFVNNSGMVFSVQSVLIVVPTAMVYAMSSISTNCTQQRNDIFYAVHAEILKAQVRS
jgi:hypothetical protein